MKKGFILTIDALVGLILASMVISVAYFAISETTSTAITDQQLSKIGLDSLTVLEKDGTLRTVVESDDASALTLYLNSLDKQICGNITIFDAGGLSITSAEKVNCTSRTISFFVPRVFHTNNDSLYRAAMEIWFDED